MSTMIMTNKPALTNFRHGITVKKVFQNLMQILRFLASHSQVCIEENLVEDITSHMGQS